MIKKIIVSSFCFVLISFSLSFAAPFEPNWNYKGKLESLNQDHIVVSDSIYKLSSSVRLYAFSEKYVTRKDFTVGSKVVLTLNEDKSEVVVIWLNDKELP